MSKHHPLTVLNSPQLLTPCSQAHALQDEAGHEKKEASLEGKGTNVPIPVPTTPHVLPTLWADGPLESRHDCPQVVPGFCSVGTGVPGLGNPQPLLTPACPWFLGRQHLPARGV